jgi:DNA-directed RNA polymerase sigma subunit (sigma70/sigma32)
MNASKSKTRRRGRPGAHRPSSATCADLRKHRLVDAEEEAALAAATGRPATSAPCVRLVCANLRLVVSIAKEYPRGHIPLSDLVQEETSVCWKACGGTTPPAASG